MDNVFAKNHADNFLLKAKNANSNLASFSVVNDWGSSFQAKISITNNDDNNLNGWTFEFDAPFEITQIWNAEIVSRQGNRYIVRNASWNGSIDSGNSISFGLLGYPGNVATDPGNYVLNGEPITTSTGEPKVSIEEVDLPKDNSDSGNTDGEVDLPEDNSDSGNTDGEVDIPEDNSDSGNPKIGDEQNPSDTPDQNNSDSDSPQAGEFNYGEALQKSLYFYEAQRSGKLPQDNRVEWRGDSALEDGNDAGVDLSGGYYDAGDHVKFGFPMAASMTMLGWGVVEYREAYKQSGQLDEALDAIKQGTDYIIKAHVRDKNGTKEFWGQVGRGDIDHAYWGSPEDMEMERPAFKIDRQNPGSDLAGESAAALAAASIAFRPTNAAYADLLLDHAQDLFEFAEKYRGKYSDSIPDAANYYNSWSGYQDELAWGSTWLYKATGEENYLKKAEGYFQGIGQGWTQSWDDKSYGTAVLLAQETGKADYRNGVEGWLDHWSDESGGGITYTEGGLAWQDQWGSLRYSANTAFLAAVYGDTVNDPNNRYTDFAEGQVNYILGDNPNNSSYMVGFGDDFPRNPHHRGASGTTNISDPADNRYTLYGALVGGPASADDNDYRDDRSDFIRNEVALDYNAGFTGVLARMQGEFGGEPLKDNWFAADTSNKT